MGRREEPVDPSDGPVQDFACALRRLRAEAGSPSYRALAGRANYSASVLSTAARGRVLPSWPVAAAFVRACGGDEDVWLHRWREAAEALHAPPPTTVTSDPIPATARDLSAQPTRRRGPVAPAGLRYVLVTLAVVAMAAATTVATAHLMRPGNSPAAAAPPPTERSCNPDRTAAPIASPPAGANAPRVRMDFAVGTPIWGPYWNPDNLRERVVRDHPYHGGTALEVRAGPGVSAIGTIHIAGLVPGSSVGLRLWYGGQGQGFLCPFVQDPAYVIHWVPVAPAVLGLPSHAGWRAYGWRMPDVPVHGVGIQLTNTGSTDLVIDLDTVTW